MMARIKEVLLIECLFVAVVGGCWSTESCPLEQCRVGVMTCITISHTDTLTQSLSQSISSTQSLTLTPSLTASSTFTLPTPTSTATLPTPTATFTTSPTGTYTNSLTTSLSVTSSFSRSLTFSLTPTVSSSLSMSSSLSETLPKIFTLTGSITFVPTRTSTFTHSMSLSESLSRSRSLSQSVSLSISPSMTRTLSRSESLSVSGTHSVTESSTLSPSKSLTLTDTVTPTKSKTGTITVQLPVLPSRDHSALSNDDLPPPVILNRDSCSCSCVSTNKENGVSCVDLLDTTFDDKCQDGVCVGTLSDAIGSKFVFSVVLGTLSTADITSLTTELLSRISSLAADNLVERFVTRICGSNELGDIDAADCVSVPTSRGLTTLASSHTTVEVTTAVVPGTGSAVMTFFDDGFTPDTEISNLVLTRHVSSLNVVDTPEPVTEPPTPSPDTPSPPTYGTNIDPTMVVFLVAAPLLVCLIIFTIVQNEHNKRLLKEAHRELELEHAQELEEAAANRYPSRNPLPPLVQPADPYGDSAPPSEAYGGGPDQPDLSPSRTYVAEDL